MRSNVRPEVPPPRVRAQALTEARRVADSRPGRWLIAITAVLAVLGAVAVVGTAVPEDRTLSLVVNPVQLLISVTLPFLTVLLVADRHRRPSEARVAPRLLAAAGFAVCCAGFGLVVSALAVMVAPSATPGGRWHGLGMLILGSILVQLIAALVGTGLGLLIRRPALAMIATIVIPLGVWALLGVADVLAPVQEWVTPFANATHLLSGQLGPMDWARCLAIVLLWAVAPNAIGALRRR